MPSNWILLITPGITPLMIRAFIEITYDRAIVYFAESKAMAPRGISIFAILFKYHGSEVRVVQHLILDMLLDFEPVPLLDPRYYP